MRIANQLWAFVKRDYLLASASRLTFAWQLATILFAAPTMYYLGRLIQPVSSPDLQPTCWQALRGLVHITTDPPLW